MNEEEKAMKLKYPLSDISSRDPGIWCICKQIRDQANEPPDEESPYAYAILVFASRTVMQPLHRTVQLRTRYPRLPRGRQLWLWINNNEELCLREEGEELVYRLRLNSKSCTPPVPLVAFVKDRKVATMMMERTHNRELPQKEMIMDHVLRFAARSP